MGSFESIAVVLESSAPGRYVVILRCSTPIVAWTGEPPSSPKNSPICHCRAKNHSGSRTWVCRLRCMDLSRCRGASLVHVVMEGIRMTDLANDCSGTGDLHVDEIG